MKSTHDPRENYLLAALPDEEFARIAPSLEPVEWRRAAVLYRYGDKLKHAYFPVSATASLLCTMDDGASIEVAVVGNEGILGASGFMGDDVAQTQATIVHAGMGYQLNIKSLRQAFEHQGALQTVLMRFTQTLMTQMAQTTGCIRRHSVEQQLSRWLLLNLDRAASDDLLMTQELMAGILGVRRESITEAAGRLQHAGLISYTRGHIEVLDRPGLEQEACECYGVMKRAIGLLQADLNESAPRADAKQRLLGYAPSYA